MSCSQYSYISKRSKKINFTFKMKNKGTIQHLAVNSTGLKIYGAGEWKVKKYRSNGK
ncbi:Mobile element protein [Candidatus Enterovibrio altilux]|uniref:Mobile element protein n=1 Tax=Candidatus Enterovibrio altilux TaxID=1927128 RepID=A0A291B8U0_9GAMM|nr:Mobile element protein [Candidatus Enterovibrio luxaltus]